MPASQEELLAEHMAALTEADIPLEDADWDPQEADSGRPAELAGLPAAELAELLAARPERAPGPVPAGCLPRDGSGGGSGFADGGVLDTLLPGPALARFTADAHARADELDDDSQIGVLRAWRRLISWAQAGELDTITQIARRRPADRCPPAPPGELPAKLSEFLPDEIAMALTLTQWSAGTLTERALELAARPATAAALRAGQIDLAKTQVILEAVAPLSGEHAAAAEAAVLPDAAGQTTGELRKAVTAAILELDPDAVRRRREAAQRHARVESWTDPDGTASLSGRNLPPADVITADKRLGQVAAYWKKLIRAAWKHADPGGQLPRPKHGIDALRARAYLALLHGQPLDTPPRDLLPPAPEPDQATTCPDGTCPDGTASDSTGPDSTGPDGTASDSTGPDSTGPDGTAPDDSVTDREPIPGREDLPPGLRRPDPFAALPPMPGFINLTLPLTTLLGVTDSPGEAAGTGPLHADTARLLACALAGHRATRWQILLTDDDGHALAVGAARGSPGPPGSTGSGGGGGWTVKVTAEPIATHQCDHRNQEPGHDPSPGLQRLIRARTSRCAGPGCRRPAGQCDLDHTLAYDKGGRTCECGVGPGCRRCHRRKQDPAWKLEMPSPGVMVWTTPAGRRYTTRPSKHPT